MRVFIDPIAGVYEAYFDDHLEISSGTLDTTIAAGIAAAEIGIHYAKPGQGPVEVYVDEVAVRERSHSVRLSTINQTNARL